MPVSPLVASSSVNLPASGSSGLTGTLATGREVGAGAAEGAAVTAAVSTGVGVGVVFGLLRRAGLRPPFALGAVLVGAAAMASTDTSIAVLKVSDPRGWSAGDWLSDLLPHLAYGAVTQAVLETLDGRDRG